MNVRLATIVVFNLSFSPLLGFEINTHQAITYCAITTDCGHESAKNMKDFVFNMHLNEQDYNNEVFVGYNYKTYKDYIKNGEGLDGWDIKLRDNKNESYIDMIEAGSILEDAIYPNATFSGDGRFNNHFYSAQTPISINLFQSTPTIFHNSLRLNNRALFADGVFNN